MRSMRVLDVNVERSPWIGVVLSVRSSFEELVLPPDVRSRAAGVTHSGFTGYEHDATKTLFVYYGLELPSTPLLAPEFQNPLFLKTLCRGLNAKGERRLPRGFQGITAVFDLYLSAVNERLASNLDTATGRDPVRPEKRRRVASPTSVRTTRDPAVRPLACIRPGMADQAFRALRRGCPGRC